jgi:hypothetical protein
MDSWRGRRATDVTVGSIGFAATNSPSSKGSSKDIMEAIGWDEQQEGGVKLRRSESLLAATAT